MPRQAATVLHNNFTKGLITEATGLNFPDGAVTEAWNTVFERIGSARRRKGIDIESEAETFSYADSDGILREFVWNAVALNGGFTFLVLQVGASVLFYELSTETSLSASQTPIGLDLKDFKAPGSTLDIELTPASFSSGAGYLFICHPACEPVIVYYEDDTETFKAGPITIYIRDMKGLEEEGVGLTEEPTTLTATHHYNLFNQGWYQTVRVGAKSTSGGSGGNENSFFAQIPWQELS